MKNITMQCNICYNSLQLMVICVDAVQTIAWVGLGRGDEGCGRNDNTDSGRWRHLQGHHHHQHQHQHHAEALLWHNRADHHNSCAFA